MPAKTVPDRKNPYANKPLASASFTVGAEAGDAITVNVQLKDKSARDASRRVHLDWYLSDDANGDSVVATAASGGVAAGTDGAVASYVTGKAGFAVSEADGDLDFVITHSGAKTCYLVLRLPDGTLAASGAVTFAA